MEAIQTDEQTPENQVETPAETADAIAEQIAESVYVDERVHYKTDPLFRYSPTFKHAKGSFLTIKKDGTVTYRNPACIEYAAPGSKPFRMAKLKPRADGSQKTFERVKESIQKRMPIDRNGRNTFAEHAGRPVGLGYRMVATDGHTALVEYGEGTGALMPLLQGNFTGSRHVATISNPEFHLALKRSKIMAPPANHSIRLSASAEELTIASSHGKPYGHKYGEDAGDFEETLAMVSSEPWKAAFNQTYLEPVCGVWPLNVWWKSDEHAMVFEPVGGEWRYIVMPVRYEWKKTNSDDQK